jgi:hypothetical protein
MARLVLHQTLDAPPTAPPPPGDDVLAVLHGVPALGPWPRTVVLSDAGDGWAGLAARLAERGTALPGSGHGRGRVLIAAPGLPSPVPQRAMTAACVYQETVTVHPGAARRYLELVAEHRLALAELFGWELLGGFRTALVNDSEALLLWALPDWSAWARWEVAQESDPNVSIWRGHVHGVVRDWHDTVLVPASLEPASLSG